MDFLDELISDQQFNEFVDYSTQTLIESLIWNSSLDEVEKFKLMKQMVNLKSNEEAQGMIQRLQDCQPIPGYHRTAVTVYEIVAATRRAVELDNFKERHK